MDRLAIANNFYCRLTSFVNCLQASCVLTIEKIKMTKWVPRVTCIYAVMLYSLNNTLLRKQVHKKFRNDTESMISAISGQISI